MNATHRELIMLYRLGDLSPVLGQRCFIAPEAVVIGDVELGDDVSIWFNAVLRGDNDHIRIQSGTSIQECAVLHVDKGVPLTVGRRVTVGHKAMLHGCSIGDGCLIGMNAVVLNKAVVGARSLIGANALVTEGMRIPERSLVLGSPAKVVRQLDDETLTAIDAGAQSYIDKIALYNESLQAL